MRSRRWRGFAAGAEGLKGGAGSAVSVRASVRVTKINSAGLTRRIALKLPRITRYWSGVGARR